MEIILHISCGYNMSIVGWGAYLRDGRSPSKQGIQKHDRLQRTFFGTPDENRTHNCPLGGGCYIHLTTEAYLIFDDSRPTSIFALLRASVLGTSRELIIVPQEFSQVFAPICVWVIFLQNKRKIHGIRRFYAW